MRLLSFLTDIEQALGSTAGNGTWDVSRMVNYHQGLARMVLAEHSASGQLRPRGSVFLQSFTLADGSFCLKATLGWHGSDEAPVISIYGKPRLDWRAEAQSIASAWLSGPSVALKTDRLVASA